MATEGGGDGDGASPRRPELGEAPPFSSWPRIYGFVVAALVAQVIAYAAITAAYR
jgi:hypothetical protein